MTEKTLNAINNFFNRIDEKEIEIENLTNFIKENFEMSTATFSKYIGYEKRYELTEKEISSDEFLDEFYDYMYNEFYYDENSDEIMNYVYSVNNPNEIDISGNFFSSHRYDEKTNKTFKNVAHFYYRFFRK